ncbi:hypothetical protein KOI35_38575 [Actinoplanes bogorensis]|uniref:Uncharacterized protein n=1 Tax=Paractinoplanes bogorensis TaxID=1610840 RepID=A0ABS5Z4T3_9ACTN|nr:hypothetical protein [Actinoplanes bogorensis]MBU2669435.1 hypothetical protein [Actinoplanes bogorensis]
MGEKPNIGRAPVGRPPKGRARVGRAVGKAPTPENARTELFALAKEEPPPVFVDPSGGRRKWLRWTAYAVGFVLIAALVAVWVSQFTGSAEPPPRAPSSTTSAT